MADVVASTTLGPASVQVVRSLQRTCALHLEEPEPGCAAVELVKRLGLLEAQPRIPPSYEPSKAAHTNRIELVDGRFAIKWYIEPAAGNDREAAMLQRLSGGGACPQYLGSLQCAAANDELVYTLAVVTKYMPDRVDGWTLLESLDPAAQDTRLLGYAQAMGTCLARVHLGLRQTSSSSSRPRHLDLDTRLRSITKRISAAQSLVPELPALDMTQAASSWVEQRNIDVQDVHGDVHLGQFLFASGSPDVVEGGIALVDFEGDPVESVEERGQADSPWRDLASLRRSITMVFLARDHDLQAPALCARVVQACTDAYLAGNPAAAADETLLPWLELEKAAGEVVYASRFLPSWLPAARAGYVDAWRQLQGSLPDPAGSHGRSREAVS